MGISFLPAMRHSPMYDLFSPNLHQSFSFLSLRLPRSFHSIDLRPNHFISSTLISFSFHRHSTKSSHSLKNDRSLFSVFIASHHVTRYAFYKQLVGRTLDDGAWSFASYLFEGSWQKEIGVLHRICHQLSLIHPE